MSRSSKMLLFMPHAVALLGAAALFAGGRSWASKLTTKHPQQHNGKFRISSSSFHRPRRAGNLCPSLAFSYPACAVKRRTSFDGVGEGLYKVHLSTSSELGV
ncbi:hypothetical protein AURDEDRAFT_178130 [Auricularia subglabra TFB-10046 SS5]|uniref:Uncharacterized protein n=1 Tax=Auricularia subglabra (strain TFB-10046 / SS5) TaxID=717982 RepID=J0WKE3_AURST|nr:hypothetical protein AURDEDRAFT_178130 [Auricularia subglabra TFB-10046 SS5]